MHVPNRAIDYRLIRSVIIIYDRLQVACYVMDIVDGLLPGLKSSMISPSVAINDTVVTYFIIFGLLLRNLE